jgi:hypothetical protein
VLGNGAAAPTGTVTFLDGTTMLGTAPLDATGHATLATTLGAGSHSLTAVFGGDADFAPSTSNAVVQVVTNVSTDGPIVTNLRRFGFHAGPTTLVLTFSAALDPTRAQDPAAYQIITLGGPGRGGRRVGHRIAVLRAAYDPTTHSVTLDPAERLDVHNRYKLIVSGTGPIGLIDTSGRLLDGKNTGVPGSDYTTVISFATLANFPAGPARTSSRPARKPVGIPAGPAAAFRRVRDQWATGPVLISGFTTTIATQVSAPGHPIAASRRAVKAHH